MDALAAQIQEAIAQADFLRRVSVAVNLQRHLVGARLDGDAIDANLDLASAKFRVDRLGAARNDAAG